jgi:phosphoribosylformylglycinamidine synthase subunit PurL
LGRTQPFTALSKLLLCGDTARVKTLIAGSSPSKEQGFNINTDKNFRKDAFLFGERHGRVVIPVSPVKRAAFEQPPQNKDVNFTQLGKAAGPNCHIDGDLFGSIAVAKKHYDTALERILD